MAAEQVYTHVIVGAGAAGCVLASRLSEQSSNRVLLIEAGPDTPPGEEPADTLDSYPIVAYFNRSYHWDNIRVNLSDPANGGSGLRRYEQARVVGGGTTINGMFAVRGLPSDFAEWAATGAEGWDWDGILPYFKKLERDLDYPEDPNHGSKGPLPLRRIDRRSWSPFSKSVASALETQGFADIKDHNSSTADGFFPMAINNVDGERISAARAYLTREVRKRPNLILLASTQVVSIIFAGRKVGGVELRTAGGAISRIRASEVIVCAGALQSPGLLMRAGIGPAEHLQEYGIAVLADRPGVGANLQDHPMVAVAAYLRPESRLPETMQRHIQMGLRYSSGLHGVPPGDMFILASNRAAWHPLGRRLASVLVCANKAYSTGEVRLTGPTSDDAPFINFRQLSDERDLVRLERGMHVLWNIISSQPVSSAISEAFPASFSDTVRKLGAVSRRNWAFTGITAGVMSLGPAVRKLIIDRLISPEAKLSDLMRSPEALRAWVIANATGSWHPAGTSRMGSPEQRGAVVDRYGRVIGVEGLRVADASIMPTIISANTMLTTMAAAEKIADEIKAGN